MSFGFDIAQICENGHIANWFYRNYPERNKRYCDRCGAATITACPKCQAPIRGGQLESGTRQPPVPRFCVDCGEPFPWTQARLRAAREFARELNLLTEQEIHALEEAIEDLVRDAPAVQVAAARYRKIVSKAGPAAAARFRAILSDVLSEPAKRLMFLS